MTVTVVSPQQTVSVVSAGGAQGLDAYQVAVFEGFAGTRAEWLASLQGADGTSAYEAAVSQGFIGTEAEWLASLQGVDGTSAYQAAVSQGFIGTEAEWIASLQGADGGIIALKDAEFVPDWVQDLLAVSVPANATSVGGALVKYRFTVVDAFVALNGRLPVNGDNIGPAINLAAANLRAAVNNSPQIATARGLLRTGTFALTMGAGGGIFYGYTDEIINLTELRVYGGVLIDFENCPIELRTPGVEGVNTLGTWFTKFYNMLFFAPSGVNMPRIGWLDGRTNKPAGVGHVEVAANKSFHNIHMHGDYEFAVNYTIASESVNYYKCIWGSNNPNSQKLLQVLTSSNHFNVVSNVPGVTELNGARDGINESYIGVQFFGCEWRQRAITAVGETYAARAAIWIDGVKAAQFYGGFINAANSPHAILLCIKTGSVVYHHWAHGLHIEPESCECVYGLVNEDNLGIRGLYFNDHEPLVKKAIFDLNGYGNTILDFTYIGPCDRVPLFINGAAATVHGLIKDTAPGSGADALAGIPGPRTRKININIGDLRRFRGTIQTQFAANLPDAAGNINYQAITHEYIGPVQGHQSINLVSPTYNISTLENGELRVVSAAGGRIDNIIRSNNWPFGMVIDLVWGGGGNVTLGHLTNLSNGALFLKNGADTTLRRVRLKLTSGSYVAGWPTYVWMEI